VVLVDSYEPTVRQDDLKREDLVRCQTVDANKRRVAAALRVTTGKANSLPQRHLMLKTT
jgi:hypothetical protein